MNLRLSIIVPLYNSAAYMCKCIESLLNQDIPHSDYEIILVNDGSPDNSKEIADEYARQYACVKVISQSNKGVSGARNTGIRNASGKYLYFVDPDDYVKTNSIKALLDRMDADDLDMLRFRYIMVDEDGKVLALPSTAKIIDYSSQIMKGSDFLCNRLGITCFVWTFIYRTSIIKENNLYCSEGVYFDDVDWMPKVLSRVNRIDSIATERHFYVVREGSLVNNLNESQCQRYLNGVLQIVDILQQDKKFVVDRKVRRWYERQQDVLICAYVIRVATFFYSDRFKWLKRIDNFVSPCRLYKVLNYQLGSKIKIKMLLTHLSPQLLCKLFHFKKMLK